MATMDDVKKLMAKKSEIDGEIKELMDVLESVCVKQCVDTQYVPTLFKISVFVLCISLTNFEFLVLSPI